MGLDLVDFCRVHGLPIGTVQIEPGVSPYPRTIMIPLCPQCDKPIYLYNKNERPDPIISSKFGEEFDDDVKKHEWIASCWTAGCDFYIPFEEEQLLRCHYCRHHFMNNHHLWDHMMFQCTPDARATAQKMSQGLGVQSAPPMVVASPKDKFVLDEEEE